MASQELKTQLIFEAANAIKTCEALQTSLDKISHIDFSNVAKGFADMAKVLASSQTKAAASVKRTKKQVDNANAESVKAAKDFLKKSDEITDDILKKREKEKADLEKIRSLTLDLIALENKAKESVLKKAFQESDFNDIERHLNKVAAQIDKIRGDNSVVRAINPFLGLLKDTNAEAIARAKQRASEAEAKQEEERLRRLQNLFNRHRAIMQDISDKYSANPKVNLKKEQAELVELSREVGRLAIELGKVGQAASYFRQAFDLAKGRKEFKGLVDEITKFRQAQNISNADWKALGARLGKAG